MSAPATPPSATPTTSRPQITQVGCPPPPHRHNPPAPSRDGTVDCRVHPALLLRGATPRHRQGGLEGGGVPAQRELLLPDGHQGGVGARQESRHFSGRRRFESRSCWDLAYEDDEYRDTGCYTGRHCHHEHCFDEVTSPSAYLECLEMFLPQATVCICSGPNCNEWTPNGTVTTDVPVTNPSSVLCYQVQYPVG